MKLAAILILAATAAHAEPRLVYVPEIPDAFHAIPLTTVPWGENTAEDAEGARLFREVLD